MDLILREAYVQIAAYENIVAKPLSGWSLDIRCGAFCHCSKLKILSHTNAGGSA